MYVRFDHLSFMPDENRVEYRDTRRCFSSAHAPTSGITKPSSSTAGLASFVILLFVRFSKHSNYGSSDGTKQLQQRWFECAFARRKAPRNARMMPCWESLAERLSASDDSRWGRQTGRLHLTFAGEGARATRPQRLKPASFCACTARLKSCPPRAFSATECALQRECCLSSYNQII